MKTVKEAYAEKLRDLVGIRRYTGTNPRVSFTRYCRARVLGVKPEQIIGNVGQNSMTAIVLWEDLVKKQFPIPVTDKDFAVVNGKEVKIQYVDTNTIKDGMDIIALKIIIAGVQ